MDRPSGGEDLRAGFGWGSAELISPGVGMDDEGAFGGMRLKSCGGRWFSLVAKGGFGFLVTRIRLWSNIPNIVTSLFLQGIVVTDSNPFTSFSTDQELASLLVFLNSEKKGNFPIVPMMMNGDQPNSSNEFFKALAPMGYSPFHPSFHITSLGRSIILVSDGRDFFFLVVGAVAMGILGNIFRSCSGPLLGITVLENAFFGSASGPSKNPVLPTPS